MIKHQPINYARWNLDGTGANINRFLNQKEKLIWEKALPFQDKREDIGHAEAVTYFTIILTKTLKGDRSITVPTAILHDIGWNQMTKEELDEFYMPDFHEREPRLRKRHQEQGVILAKKILKSLGYDKSKIEKIIEIISEHDTRKGFISLEDGIVRDADKLWRFTLPLIGVAINKRGFTSEEYCEQVIKDIDAPGFFYSDVSRSIARIELKAAQEAYARLNPAGSSIKK